MSQPKNAGLKKIKIKQNKILEGPNQTKPNVKCPAMSQP